MSCHRDPHRKALLDALRLADSSLKLDGARFWHGSGDKGTVTAAEQAAALDGAWLAATDTARWDKLSREDRLGATSAWLQARTDALDDGLTAAATAALNRYTERLVAKERRRETGKKWGTRVGLTAVATALVTIGVMAGSTQPHDADAASLFTAPEVTQSQQDAVSVRALDGAVKTASGKTVVFSSPTKGRCDVGEKLVKVGKAKTVTWEWRNGNVGKKTVKKGQRVCRAATAAAVNSVGPTGYSKDVTVNAAGVITKVNLPKTPTVVDIKALGLTKDSKIDPSIDLPQPVITKDLQVRSADTFRPVSTHVNGDGTATVMFALDGGNGNLAMRAPDGSVQTVTLRDGQTTTFERTYNLSAATRDHLSGVITADLGQDDLPLSAVGGWDIPTTYDPAKNVNTAIIGQGLSTWSVRTDGSVYIYDGTTLNPS